MTNLKKRNTMIAVEICEDAFVGYREAIKQSRGKGTLKLKAEADENLEFTRAQIVNRLKDVILEMEKV